MLKFLSFILIIPLLLCGQIFSKVKIEKASNIEVIENNNIIKMSDSQLGELKNLLEKSFLNGNFLPALSIAIESEVEKDIQEGIWIKFTFDKICYKEKLPFDQLLMKVCKNCKGADLIRGNKGKFEGRCLHFEFNDSLDSVYEYVLSLKESETISKDNKIDILKYNLVEKIEDEDEETIEIIDDELVEVFDDLKEDDTNVFGESNIPFKSEKTLENEKDNNYNRVIDLIAE